MDSHMLPQSDKVTPFSQYINSLKAPKSKRTMIQILNMIAEHLGDNEFDAQDYPWHEVTKEDTGAVRDWMTEQYAPATTNKGLSALRGVLKEAWRMGLMDIRDYWSAISIPNIENHTEKVGRLIEDAEIQRILSMCQESESDCGIRDYAMIALMYATGARRSEVVNLDIADFDANANSLAFRETKGWKDRTVFIGKDIAVILSAWVALLDTPGALFRRISKADRIIEGRLTDQGLYHILADRAQQAMVSNITPHDFRYTFISKMINNGVDLVTVAKIVGHVDVKQTMAYDRRGIEPMQSALLALPG
jgi:site-specific recombinase XerD